MVTNSRPWIDLQAQLVADFVHTNVTGLDADPSVKIHGVDDWETTVNKNGLILLWNCEESAPNWRGSNRADEIYLVTAHIRVPPYVATAQTEVTTDAQVSQIVEEIKRVLRVENTTSDKDYLYDVYSPFTGDKYFREIKIAMVRLLKDMSQ